jgi:polysaccharide export outer membrane protein
MMGRLNRNIPLLAAMLCMLALGACVNATKVAPEVAAQTGGAPYQLIPIDASYRGDVAPRKTRTAPPSPTVEAPYSYRLGAGDVILLNLFVPDVSGEQGMKRIIPQPQSTPDENRYALDESGHIVLPLAGIIDLQNLTLSEARERITERFRTYFRQPQLEIRMEDFISRRVMLSGEFNAPQTVTLTREPLKIFDAVTKVEGPTPSADLASALLQREDGTRMMIDLHALLKEGDHSQNFVLRDGDRLHLPRNHGNQIFITGEVMEPKTILLDSPNATLTEVLSEVQGLDAKTADPSAVYVLREQPMQTAIYQLNLEDAQGYLYGDRFRMQPRDVVFIGSRPITQWSRFVEQLLPGAIATLAQPAPYIVR